MPWSHFQQGRTNEIYLNSCFIFTLQPAYDDGSGEGLDKASQVERIRAQFAEQAAQMHHGRGPHYLDHCSCAELTSRLKQKQTDTDTQVLKLEQTIANQTILSETGHWPEQG